MAREIRFDRSELIGVEAAIKGMNTAKETTLQKMMQGMKRFAKDVYDKSQYYVPVSPDGNYGKPPGELKRTGETHVMGAYRKGTYSNEALTHIVSYGYANGHEAFYAVYVHEIERFKHEPPTQWKYLEQAVKDVIAQYGNVIRFDIGGDITMSADSGTKVIGDF